MKSIIYMRQLVLFMLVIMLSWNSATSQRAKLKIVSHENMTRIQNLEGVEITKRSEESDLTQQQTSEDITLNGQSIPMVFHVLYNDEVEKISVRQIISQVIALNRDFLEGPDKKDIPERLRDITAAVELGFCLAATNPVGDESTGINYHKIQTETWKVDDAMKSIRTGGVDAWDPEKYLNVWVVNLADDIGGFAQMPGGPLSTDGIVIDYQYVGISGTAIEPYNEGKTLTHLVGNYLNLYSLWGTEPCGDDGVSDTPLHNAPNSGCPAFKHVSTCLGHKVELTSNFMDSSSDACKNHFTKGQKERMHSTLSDAGLRPSLLSGEIECLEYDFEEMETKQPLTLFPNPANERVYIERSMSRTDLNDISVQVYSIDRKLIYNNVLFSNDEHQVSINVSQWPNGIYNFVFIQEENIIESIKIVVTNN